MTITIYRDDAADAARGTPINVDCYMVWERIPNHLDFMKMVNTASTEDNATCAASWKSTSLWSRSCVEPEGGAALRRQCSLSPDIPRDHFRVADDSFRMQN